MIVPLSHENLRGRRWPWVTITIIALCSVIFLFTNGRMDRELAQTGTIRLRILILSARFPDAPMTPDAKEMVQAFRLQHENIYQEMATPSTPELAAEWDSFLPTKDLVPQDANAEMGRLCAQLTQSQSGSIAWDYAFHPVHAFLWTYITATFLHGGWMHLIFNMWFFWLAGTILEDLWGRAIYPIFYLLGGALAWAVHGIVFPHSLLPALGASGAIAGLMGAFLARFPKTRIRLGWVIWVRIVKFYVPAYIILPLWLALQIVPGIFSRAIGMDSGIAYWAHIGGFAFGALGAVLLRATGVEQSADRAIESKVSWTADPLIVRATDCLAENNVEGAISALRQQVKEKPDSIDGWDLLLKAQHRKQYMEGQKESLAALCRLHVASGEFATAASEYEWYKNVGGTKLPRGVWLELCRYLEREQRWQLAADEYEKLAEANPTERAGVSALVAAGRICATRLNEPARAEQLLSAAAASPVPHSDLDAVIQENLKLSAAATPQPGAYTR